MSSSHIPDAAPMSGNVPGPNLVTHASTSMGALSVYGLNGNIANSHNTGSSLSIAAAAAAVAPVGFDVDSPEDMDFEATRTKRS